MIKYILHITLLIGTLGLNTQCHQPTPKAPAANEPVKNTENRLPADSSLYASLESVDDTPNLQGNLMVRFTVNNPTKDTLRFTAYHTPFEGFISKFLTVTDIEGKEVSYHGPMVKRVMPPPADTYHTLAPGQTESVTFDLQKGYKIANAGTYTLQYNGERISGIANGSPITIVIAE